MDFFINKDNTLDKWRKFYHEALKPSLVLQDKINKAYSEMFNKDDRVLGIKVRGTDYLLKPKDHPIQPDNDEVIKMAYSIIKKYNLTKIFLACEDNDIIKLYQKEFNGIMVTFPKNVINYAGEGNITKNDNVDNGLEYATEMYLLSMCTCIIGGRTSGSTAAMILSNGFEYSYFWDLGVY
jgi:hypothetical protein